MVADICTYIRSNSGQISGMFYVTTNVGSGVYYGWFGKFYQTISLQMMDFVNKYTYMIIHNADTHQTQYQEAINNKVDVHRINLWDDKWTTHYAKIGLQMYYNTGLLMFTHSGGALKSLYLYWSDKAVNLIPNNAQEAVTYIEYTKDTNYNYLTVELNTKWQYLTIFSYGPYNKSNTTLEWIPKETT